MLCLRTPFCLRYLRSLYHPRNVPGSHECYVLLLLFYLSNIFDIERDLKKASQTKGTMRALHGVCASQGASNSFVYPAQLLHPRIVRVGCGLSAGMQWGRKWKRWTERYVFKSKITHASSTATVFTPITSLITGEAGEGGAVKLWGRQVRRKDL
jgi:hypothetical protein